MNTYEGFLIDDFFRYAPKPNASSKPEAPLSQEDADILKAIQYLDSF